MTIFHASIAFQLDSALPRDAVSIHPHYFGTDAQGLADRLKTNLITNPLISTTCPFIIRIYDAEKPPPSYPLATAQQTGAPKVTNLPRELALCLSYYSTWNRPRYRGRLYIPFALCGPSGPVTLRPSQVMMDNCIAWKDYLTTGLPSGTNWVVYSPTNKTSYGVSNVWCDDEWDIVRSRGLKGTSRSVASVP
jgi:hypothetical protein